MTIFANCSYGRFVIGSERLRLFAWFLKRKDQLDGFHGVLNEAFQHVP